MAAASALDALAAEAESLGGTQAADDTQGRQAGAPAEPVPSLDDANTQALCFIVAMFREVTASPLVFNPPIRTLADRLPDDKLPGLLAPWARVASHYRVDLSRITMADHPLAVALMTTGPALWSIAQDLRHELRARAAKPITPEPDSQDPGRAE